MTQDTPHGAAPIDVDAALGNPSAYFAQPQDVLAHAGLSPAVRLRLLQQWEQDARLLAEAENEGMGGGEQSMLARVQHALRALDGVPPAGADDEATGEAAESIGAAARSIAGNLDDAADKVQHAASRAHAGVVEIREVIRALPVTAAVCLFAFGYLFGRASSPGPTRRGR